MTTADPSSTMDPTSDLPAKMSEKSACSLHVRLFDGSSLKARFDANATLATAVRAFVSDKSSTDMPYNFRLMDLPRPSRTIEISEENQSLRELGLCPTATLVLVPVKDFTDAYAAGGPSGVVQRGLSMGFEMVTGALIGVGATVRQFMGAVASSDTATDGPYIAGTGDVPLDGSSEKSAKGRAATEDKATAKDPSSKFTTLATLADRKRNEQTDSYNGNALSVEPKPDE